VPGPIVMLERYDPADSSVPAPLSAPVLNAHPIRRRLVDWSLVAGSFGLILFATAALRPPAPHGVANATAPVVLASQR